MRQEAIAELKLGDTKDALGSASLYVRKNPYDPVGHDVFGRALATARQKKAAIDQLSVARAGYKVRNDNAGIAGVVSELSMLESGKN